MTILRSAVFNLVFFGVTFLATLTATAARLAAPDHVTAAAVLWARSVIACLRVICGIRVEVTGRENLPQGPALIASRHQSAFDTLIWLSLLPRCCYVLKSELLRIPLWGQLIVATRMIAVNRTGGAAAVRALARAGEQAAHEQRQIVIFPEGTRGEPGHMLPLQPGIAALAMQTGLPVVPVVTDSGLRWGRRAFRKRPGTIHIVMLPPIPDGLGRKELMKRLAQALQTPVDNSVN